MEDLVSTEWLAGEIGKQDLVVFDATKYLPNEAQDGRKEFTAARIPGARYFDIDQVADPDSDLPHMVPSPARFAKLVGALGVSNASRVVFYDQHGWRAATGSPISRRWRRSTTSHGSPSARLSPASFKKACSAPSAAAARSCWSAAKV